jgi:hypothetical protein
MRLRVRLRGAVSHSVPSYWPRKVFLEAGLYYGDFRSKLVYFEAQEKCFLCFKKPTLE